MAYAYIILADPDPSIPPGVKYQRGVMHMPDGRVEPIYGRNHDAASWDQRRRAFFAFEKRMENARLPYYAPGPSLWPETFGT